MIFAAVTIGSNGTFAASTGQILAVYVSLTVSIGILNSMPSKFLHRVSFAYGELRPLLLSFAYYISHFYSVLQSFYYLGDHNSYPGQRARSSCKFEVCLDWGKMAVKSGFFECIDHPVIRLRIIPAGGTMVSYFYSVYCVYST